jgi:multiple sugar transport system ATP-binding protein
VYVTHDQEEAMTMSDRIAVLNDGRIEQRGTPDELYREPTNVFVASFIGNPSMNFMDGEVRSVTEETLALVVEGNQFEFDVRHVAAVDEGDDVVLGFRPEVVEVYSDSERGDLAGELSLVERIGDRALATIDRSSGEVRATVSADNSLTELEPVSFSFDSAEVHVFDRADGRAVARGARPRVDA